ELAFDPSAMEALHLLKDGVGARREKALVVDARHGNQTAYGRRQKGFVKARQLVGKDELLVRGNAGATKQVEQGLAGDAEQDAAGRRWRQDLDRIALAGNEEDVGNARLGDLAVGVGPQDVVVALVAGALEAGHTLRVV